MPGFHNLRHGAPRHDISRADFFCVQMAPGDHSPQIRIQREIQRSREEFTLPRALHRSFAKLKVGGFRYPFRDAAQPDAALA